MERRARIKIGDIILMSVILITAVFLLLLPFLKKRADSAEIVFVQTGEIRTVSLGKDRDFDISSQDIALTVCVKDGEIFVSESTCRDGICRGTPPISRAGQSIVCLPAGVIVRIVGEEVAVDGISG